MGHVATIRMSRAFIVPLLSAFVCSNGYAWPKLSKCDSMTSKQDATI